jgi:hypothetical protein
MRASVTLIQTDPVTATVRDAAAASVFIESWRHLECDANPGKVGEFLFTVSAMNDNTIGWHRVQTKAWCCIGLLDAVAPSACYFRGPRANVGCLCAVAQEDHPWA